jgi:hypothetical protein
MLPTVVMMGGVGTLVLDHASVPLHERSHFTLELIALLALFLFILSALLVVVLLYGLNCVATRYLQLRGGECQCRCEQPSWLVEEDAEHQRENAEEHRQKHRLQLVPTPPLWVQPIGIALNLGGFALSVALASWLLHMASQALP